MLAKAVTTDESPTLEPLLPALRSHLQLDALIVVPLEEHLDGWRRVRCDADHVPDPSAIATALAGSAAAWDLAASHPWDEPLEGPSDPDDPATAALHAMLAPRGLGATHQLRALLSAGRQPVAWVAGFGHRPISRSQRARFAALLPALRQRLARERWKRDERVLTGVIHALLAEQADPIVVLGADHRILLANRTGRAWLDRDRAATASLLAAVAGGQPAVAGAQVLVLDDGHVLVRLPHAQPDERVLAIVDQVADVWQLTPRQRAVLHLLTCGYDNALISAELGVCARTVEFHITAILDRSGAESRTQLVARVLRRTV